MAIWVALLLAIAAAGCYPVRRPAPRTATASPRSSLSGNFRGYPDAPPERALRLLFIHHSVGGQLLADPGPLDPHEKLSIHRSHPNGGGLRSLLENDGYIVHEAAYGSVIGENTDLFDWLPKFRDHMSRVLANALQDQALAAVTNDVILFKSCYPNSAFREHRGEPADPAGRRLTLSNAKATFAALRDEFARHPDVLFVYLTTPPLLPRQVSRPLWKHLARMILGRPPSDREQSEAAAIARTFNNWLKSPTGWLDGYSHRNVVVFDYFDVLTGDGRSDFLEFPAGNGTDDHPSTRGQQIAASRLAPFINRAVRRAGLCTDASADDKNQETADPNRCASSTR